MHKADHRRARGHLRVIELERWSYFGVLKVKGVLYILQMYNMQWQIQKFGKGVSQEYQYIARISVQRKILRPRPLSHQKYKHLRS